MTDMVHCVNAWCSSSVVAMADQEQQLCGTTVPVQDGS